ncbi:CdiA family toxin C-terminal domain-containing protein [Chitinimonas viridis]|uniref:CdiA family toxin C-terminal domain-containing protein n=1 Tax=Chitinimonas viridis TaxID=664880 RepID=A0ABT8B2V1_9NEIS|nr:CdiA family toxin C-terminal domain-containing protein [Chitinimonas viridis]MDN3575878.1 CdiA family toxin C-terminal domain-containing protein [Chitinimonas viridis]
MRENRLLVYRPYRKQQQFHAAIAVFRERLLRAGNQNGKTFCCGAELAFHLTGMYPDWWQGRRWDRPILAWAASETGESTRDNPQRALLGLVGELGTGAVPRDRLGDYGMATGVSNLFDFIKVRHATGSLSRILNRPRFAGPVQPGRQYVLIDDALPQGDMLAALARHIQQGGGHIAAIVALTGKQFSAPLAPAPSLLRQVREKYGDMEDAFRQATGYDYQSLTASEARYLRNYKSVDVVRDRILAESRQRAKPTDKRSVNESRKTPPQGGVAVSANSILPSKGSRFGAEGGNGLAQKTGLNRETQHGLQKSAAARTESPPRAASSPEHYNLSQAASPITSLDGHAKNALATHWIDRREARIQRNANREAYPNRQVPRSVMIDLAGLSSAHPSARYVAMQSLVDSMQRAAAWGGYSSATSTEPWDGNVSITPISAAEQQQIDMVAESFMVAAELTNASMTQDGFAGRDNALKDLRKQMCSLSQNQQAQLVVQLTDQIAATKEMRGWYGNIGWKADQAKFKDAVQATGGEEILHMATGPGVLVGGSTTKDMASLPKVVTAGVAPAFGNSLSMLRRQVATGVPRLGQYNVPSKVFRYAYGIAFEPDIATHITRLDGFTQSKGIGGAHNLDAFMDAATKNNVNIISQAPGGVKGIYIIKYEIPVADKVGNVMLDANGGIVYKGADFTKTVYDPRVISDQAILELGQQAASSGYANSVANGIRAYTAEAGGISFRVYRNEQTGLITNFHPR